MYTEDEAKTKWCPEYQVSGADGFNNRDDVPGYPRCIASECMHWRWIIMPMFDADTYLGEGQTDRGYCGLSGKP
ncbi:MAG: hypothetical protein ACWGN2_11830 [Anaerolineales bacterium]